MFYSFFYLVPQDQQHGGVGCTRRRLMHAEIPKPHPWSPLLPPIQLAAPSTALTGAIRRPALVEAPPGRSISHGSPFPCLNPIWKFPTERERKSTTAAATQGTINTWMESRLINKNNRADSLFSIALFFFLKDLEQRLGPIELHFTNQVFELIYQV